MRRIPSWGPLLFAVVLGLVWLVALRPVPLGGPLEYVTIHGHSMDPTFSEGDLVVVRQADRYGIGDVVAFAVEPGPPGTRAVVIHRIVDVAEGAGGRESVRFVTQGDNNGYVDGFEVKESDIMGKRLIRIPRVGGWMATARSNPVPTAIATAGVASLIAAPAKKGRRRARRGRGVPVPRPRTKTIATAVLGTGGAVAAAVTASLLLASLALGGLAITRPTTTSVTAPASFEHSAAFSYRAPAEGDVYADGVADTGEPVFRGLADRVNVRIDYRLAGEDLTDVSGTLLLQAILALPDGWTRTIAFGGEQAFTGTETSATAVLSLATLDRFIEQLAAQADVSAQTYTLTLVAGMDVSGAIDGTAFRDQFSAELAFLLDPVELQVQGGVASEADPFRTTESASVDRTTSEPATIDLLGLELAVDTARTLAVAGVGIGALTGFVLLLLTWRASHAPEPARIARRYRPLLVARTGSDADGWGRVVDVADIDDLARIAGRGGSMIVHQDLGVTHEYFVIDGQVTYRYSAGGSRV